MTSTLQTLRAQLLRGNRFSILSVTIVPHSHRNYSSLQPKQYEAQKQPQDGAAGTKPLNASDSEKKKWDEKLATQSEADIKADRSEVDILERRVDKLEEKIEIMDKKAQEKK